MRQKKYNKKEEDAFNTQYRCKTVDECISIEKIQVVLDINHYAVAILHLS